MADRWNLVVIGAGPGGYEAAVEGAKKGMKVALVENRELGGTCLNRGCIPTKTILHTAELYHELQAGPSIGLRTEQAAVDMDLVQQRKEEVLKQLRAGIAALMKTNKITVYDGTGTIVDRCHVSVRPESGGPVLLETDHILIATGSVPACPPIPGADLPGGVTSDGLLDIFFGTVLRRFRLYSQQGADGDAKDPAHGDQVLQFRHGRVRLPLAHRLAADAQPLGSLGQAQFIAALVLAGKERFSQDGGDLYPNGHGFF